MAIVKRRFPWERSKHRNEPTWVDEIRFASRKEAARYQELSLAEKEGLISDLKVHPRFKVDFHAFHLCDYVADFCYKNPISKTLIVEDVKGRKAGVAYDLFKLKKALMKALINIEVQEI